MQLIENSILTFIENFNFYPFVFTKCLTRFSGKKNKYSNFKTVAQADIAFHLILVDSEFFCGNFPFNPFKSNLIKMGGYF